jgi:hypothetical protein
VSILNRLSLDGHLTDAQLTAVWTDRGGEPSHPHLDACSGCRGRMQAFTAWMDGLRFEAVAEADEAFPVERLAAQHGHILRRIEAAERPTRVITFPTSSRPMSGGSSHVRRWITAAAAAGLIVGVAVGQVMNLRRAVGETVVETTASRGFGPPRGDRPAGQIQPVSAAYIDNDAAFMADVDASMTRRAPSVLHAIDEVTPRAPFIEERR